MKKPKKTKAKRPPKKSGELRDDQVEPASGGLGGDPDRPVIAGSIK
jgi:hypothetical protein